MDWKEALGPVSRCAVTIQFCAALALSIGAVSAAQARAAALADQSAGGPGAGAGDVARLLELKSGSINTTQLNNLLDNLPAGFDADVHYVIQLDGPMTPDRRAGLESAGVVLGQYLPMNAFIVRLDAAAPEALAGHAFVVWVGEFQSEWKIDPQFGSRVLTTDARKEIAARGMTQVVIALFEGEDLQLALTDLAALGAQIIDSNLSGNSWLIDAVIAPQDAAAVAMFPEVQFIEEAPEGALRNDSNRWIVQSNVSPQTPVWDRGIHGESQVGGLIDGTIRESHCMFDDSVAVGPTHRKIVAMRNAGGVDSHGTHTAGTIAGDASPFNVYTTNDGIAFAAKLSFSNVDNVFGSPSTLKPRLQNAHADGARTHSNSWGDDGTTAYTTWCVQIDDFSYLNEDSLVLFAVSNGGNATTPENAKNCVGVGASNDTPSQAGLCSGGTGPTADGRRKPEVFAPGCNTTSANSNTSCSVTGATGTSMACPAVSGAGLLVRQYFTNGFYPTGAAVPANALSPTGALIKAALINSSVDMTSISGYPSNQEGWGRVLLDNALYFTGDARKLYVVDVRNASGLSTGQQATYGITVNSNAVPLRVTVVWTEPAAALNAGNPVVNNLDLEVTTGATLYRGNVFSSGQSTTGGTADAKNNVEQVHRTSPVAGPYTITIKGTAVNTGLQGYALLVSGDISLCTGPTPIDHPSNQTACTGGSATFSVAANGTAPLTYQWRKNSSPIGGATNSSYTINPVGPGDAANYDCVVTNACGSATSNPASLTVNTAPAIDSPPSSQTVCEGDAATFSVSANGTAPISYQWRKDGADIGGANSSSLTIDPVTVGSAGSYDCVVSNACGSATADAATLSVESAPSITAQPLSQNVAEGGTANFSVTAIGTPTLSYQWRKGGADIGGATADTYSISPVSAGDAGSYDVVVTNSCGSITSDAAILTVGCASCDTNCDGSTNLFDIETFVALLSPPAPAGCSPCAGDTNSDGSVNLFDIEGFVACLGGP